MKLNLSFLLILASTARAKHTQNFDQKGMCGTTGSRYCMRQGAFEHRRWVIRDCDHEGNDRVFEICPGDCAMEPKDIVRCVNPETQSMTNFYHNGKDHDD